MKFKSYASYSQSVREKYPFLTDENIFRMSLLYEGVNCNDQDSYPDTFRHYELIFTVPSRTSFALLTFLNPQSPFHLIDTSLTEKTLLYNGEYIGIVPDYEQRAFDFRNHEPFYFYVEEVNGDLVLKLNPIQMCDFFVNLHSKPCTFCFRADTVKRFRNIAAADLVKMVIEEEQKRDGGRTLRSIDEISIVTGSYLTDEEYIREMVTLVSGVKSYIRPDLRVVVGSHEGKGKKNYKVLQKAGVTVFAFPVESLDDRVRKTGMANRKGDVSMDYIRTYIDEAVDTFSEDGVIIRVVAGMGDALNDQFIGTVRDIATKYRKSPYWNVNIYMPFTHYHWYRFQKKHPYDLDYIFKYSNIINQFVAVDRQIRFKISP
jgi:hypothetical protein